MDSKWREAVNASVNKDPIKITVKITEQRIPVNQIVPMLMLRLKMWIINEPCDEFSIWGAVIIQINEL